MNTLHLWPLIFIIPFMVFGYFALFQTQKFIRQRAIWQYNSFKSFGLSDSQIDFLYSAFWGDGYSERLRKEIENPKAFKLYMLWIRILGFGFFFMPLCIYIYTFIEIINKGTKLVW